MTFLIKYTTNTSVLFFLFSSEMQTAFYRSNKVVENLKRLSYIGQILVVSVRVGVLVSTVM